MLICLSYLSWFPFNDGRMISRIRIQFLDVDQETKKKWE